MSVNTTFFIGYGIVLPRELVPSEVAWDVYEKEFREVRWRLIDLDPMCGEKGYLFAIDTIAFHDGDETRVIALEPPSGRLNEEFFLEWLPVLREEIFDLLAEREPQWIAAMRYS